MAINNGYATVEELQRHIDPGGEAQFTAGDRSVMETAIEAASRWIDNVTGTHYYTVAETRLYTADWYDLCYVDDLLSVTSLRTDEDEDGVYETNWTGIDYALEPVNAPRKQLPYRQIRIRREGDHSFPTTVRDGVQVTGAFGYAATVPAAVRQACVLIAHRLWRRKDAIFGVAGTPALGVTVVQASIPADADVLAMLRALDVRVI